MTIYTNYILPVFFIMFLSGLIQSETQTSIRVISDKASIYAEPNSDIPLNFSAQEGDIFEIEEVQNRWVKINLFSGEERYIKESKVEVIAETKPYPSAPHIRSKLCKQINEDINMASTDAVSKFPNDLEHQATHEKILMDKYILITFRNHDIPASHYSKIIECVNDPLSPIKLDIQHY